jgi:hypothetical protein
VDWTEWSRKAVGSMLERNAQWVKDLGLENPRYFWDLDKATLVLSTESKSVVASVCLVGTTSDQAGSFLWSWGNPEIPTQHGEALEIVRKFGRENELWLLTAAEIPGGKPEAIECMCIAGHLQQALGTFSDKVGDVGVYFTIMHFEHNLRAQGTDG